MIRRFCIKENFLKDLTPKKLTKKITYARYFFSIYNKIKPKFYNFYLNFDYFVMITVQYILSEGRTVFLYFVYSWNTGGRKSRDFVPLCRIRSLHTCDSVPLSRILSLSLCLNGVCHLTVLPPSEVEIQYKKYLPKRRL